MPVWWGIFAYMMVMSAIGMVFYKKKMAQQVPIGPDDESSQINYKSIGLFFALATFVLLVFFAGQRSYIFDSTDYQYAYEHYYTTELSQISDIWNGTIAGKGKIYMTILVLFKHFSGGADYNAWFTFIAIVQCTSIALFFYKWSSNFIFSIFLFLSSGCFLWIFNGMRQFLAVTFILFFVDWINERKTVPFLIIVLLAYNIHSSAILWIPVYFIINYRPWSIKFILLSVILTIAILLVSYSSILDDTDYAYLTNSSNLNGVNPFRVLVMAVPSIIAFVQRKEIEKKATSFINVCINLSVITTECYIVGMFTSGIIARIGAYFEMFNFIFLPWLIKNVFDEDTSKVINTVCIVGFVLFFCYNMYIAGNGIYNSSTLDLHYYLS